MQVRIIMSIIMFLLFVHSGIASAEKPYAPDKVPGTNLVDAEAAIDLIINKPELVIIDSRKENEYQKGHIQGAISMPDTEMTIEKLSMHVADKSRPVLFYCNGERCLRSSRAAARAHEWGYKFIYWFRGGWSEWVEKGMPVNR